MGFVTLMRIHFKMIITFFVSLSPFLLFFSCYSMQSSAQLAADGKTSSKEEDIYVQQL